MTAFSVADACAFGELINELKRFNRLRGGTAGKSQS